MPFLQLQEQAAPSAGARNLFRLHNMLTVRLPNNLVCMAKLNPRSTQPKDVSLLLPAGLTGLVRHIKLL
jgi:hypothetical protein